MCFWPFLEVSKPAFLGEIIQCYVPACFRLLLWATVKLLSSTATATIREELTFRSYKRLHSEFFVAACNLLLRLESCQPDRVASYQLGRANGDSLSGVVEESGRGRKCRRPLSVPRAYTVSLAY